MKQIELGTLTKPQGLKGEFRIKHKIDSFQLFKDLKNKLYFLLPRSFEHVVQTISPSILWMLPISNSLESYVL